MRVIGIRLPQTPEISPGKKQNDPDEEDQKRNEEWRQDRGRLSQVLFSNWQSPDAFLGKSVNGVAHRSGDDWQTGFADSGGFFSAVDDVNFSFGRVGNFGHFVLVEIGLFPLRRL